MHQSAHTASETICHEGVTCKGITNFSKDLIRIGPLPTRAEVDALHIAIAVTNQVDYLLTWNCAHLANAALRHQIDHVCRMKGYNPIIICTPEELLES
jgi:hypothetical protein